jgi:DNA-binding transcriptional ArsR family regulator
MAKILFKSKQVDSKKKVIKILKNPKLAKIVDNLKERNEVLSQFKKYKGGGITKDEARKILGKFYHDRNDSLDRQETSQLAQAFGIKGAHKYQRPARNMTDQGADDSRAKKILRERFEKEAPDSRNRQPIVIPRKGGYVGIGRLH